MADIRQPHVEVAIGSAVRRSLPVPPGPDLAVRALQELAVAAAGVLDPVALAEIAVNRAAELLGADDVWFYVWDELSQRLVGLASCGHIPAERLVPLRAEDDPVGQALLRRTPVVLSGTSRSRKTLTAVVAAPVLVNDRSIGIVIARAAAPHQFTPEQVQTFSLLGALVGPTLDSAQLYVAAQRGRAEAETLADIMRAGAIEPDPDRVIAMVSERACMLIGADYAGVALTEPDGTRKWRGMWGHRTDAWQRPGNFRGRGPFTRAIESGTTVVQLVEETEDPAAHMATHYAEGGKTVMVTPLPSRGWPPGALILGWRSEVEPTTAQIQLAETLVNYATIVVDNVRARARERELLQEAAARADELAASEARIRTLYEALTCGVLVKDGAGLVIHANAAAEEILGQTFEQMRGRHTTALWSATGADGEPLSSDGRPSVLAARSGRPVRKFTSSVFRPDGNNAGSRSIRSQSTGRTASWRRLSRALSISPNGSTWRSSSSGPSVCRPRGELPDRSPMTSITCLRHSSDTRS